MAQLMFIIYLNNGYGTFSEAQHITEPDIITCVSVLSGDFDNDGDIDISFAGATNVFLSDKIFVYKNNGAGSFTHFSEIDGGCHPWGSCRS